MKTSRTLARRNTSRLLLLAGLVSAQGLMAIEGNAFAQARPDTTAKPEAKVDAKTDAARHFKRGLELFDDNDFQGALIEFQRAYQILPTYQVLYNIGQVRFQLQDYAGALKSFERFLTEGGDKVPADRRAELERDIAKLRARVATVEVTTARGAMIYVDDVAMGTAPLSAPLQVSSGRRRLRAVVAGSPPSEKILELAGGDSTRIELPIEIATTVSTNPSPNDAATSSSPPWALWGVAGALAVGTAVTGILALSASNKADDIRKNGGSFTDFDDARKSAGTLAIVNDIVGGATIVVVVLATYFTVASGKKSSAAARAIPIVHAGNVPGGGSIGFAF